MTSSKDGTFAMVSLRVPAVNTLSNALSFAFSELHFERLFELRFERHALSDML
jgi:hypothetical protein